MEVTGAEVLEWADRTGLILSGWQRDLILRVDWSKPFEPLRLWPEPRKPVLTRRVQRRRQTRAARRRARKLPQRHYLVTAHRLAGQP
jgi:hypothetical protein